MPQSETSAPVADGPGAPSSTATGGSQGGTARATTAARGTSGGGTASGSGAGQPLVAHPATGRGFDRANVYIGFSTSQDFSQGGATLGYEDLNGGDWQADVRAIVADMNARGGLFGRKVIPAFNDHKIAAVLADPEREGQADCAYFTQDRPVIAVMNLLAPMDTPSVQACYAKNRMPFVSAAIKPVDAKQEQDVSPWLHSVTSATWEDLAPVWLDRLAANGYFKGWDTALGAPGAAPVKIGLLHQDLEPGPRGFKLLRRLLEERKIEIVEVATYSSTSQQRDMAGIQLRFRSAGVTHLLSDTSAVIDFMKTAEQQGYRPRYGMNTFHRMAYNLEKNAPPRQLVGTLGVGHMPPSDVLSAAMSAPGAARCEAVMNKGGQRFDGKRVARLAAYAFCDGAYLIEHMAKTGGAVTLDGLLTGFTRGAKDFVSALTFSGGFATRRSQGGAVKDVAWDPKCACFRYMSDRLHPL